VSSLDDTSNCPLGTRCESCGAEDAFLGVDTIVFGRLGVACLTMCPRCVASGVAPPITVGTAMRLIGEHAAHLGVTVDEMAAALDEQRP
jgi:hypothetical protein